MVVFNRESNGVQTYSFDLSNTCTIHLEKLKIQFLINNYPSVAFSSLTVKKKGKMRSRDEIVKQP